MASRRVVGGDGNSLTEVSIVLVDAVSAEVKIDDFVAGNCRVISRADELQSCFGILDEQVDEREVNCEGFRVDGMEHAVSSQRVEASVLFARPTLTEGSNLARFEVEGSVAPSPLGCVGADEPSEFGLAADGVGLVGGAEVSPFAQGGKNRRVDVDG